MLIWWQCLLYQTHSTSYARRSEHPAETLIKLPARDWRRRPLNISWTNTVNAPLLFTMRFLSCLWTCLATFPFTLAMLVNVTVDDAELNSQGDLVINYTSGGWVQGNACTSCTAHLNPTLVFGGAFNCKFSHGLSDLLVHRYMARFDFHFWAKTRP